MKGKTIILTGILGILYIALKSDVDGPAHHGHGDITGAPSGSVGHCQTSSCHGSNNPLTLVNLQVIDTTTMEPVIFYVADSTYLVKLTGDATAIATNLPGYGFQVSAVLGSHTLAGSYTIPSAITRNIHTYACGATTVVEHTTTLAQDSNGVNKYSIEFYWTAPSGTSDSVTFFSLLNAVNGDGGKSGDYPNAAPKVTIYQSNSAKVSVVYEPVNNYSCFPNPTTSILNIKSNTVIKSVVITDITGHLIKEQHYNTNSVSVDVSTIASGVYYVRTNGTDIQKFVKI